MVESVQHNLNNTNDPSEIVHVLEVPNCFFRGVQICLMVKSREEIPKCKHMVALFRHGWLQAKREQSGLILPFN